LIIGIVLLFAGSLTDSGKPEHKLMEKIKTKEEKLRQKEEKLKKLEEKLRKGF